MKSEPHFLRELMDEFPVLRADNVLLNRICERIVEVENDPEPCGFCLPSRKRLNQRIEELEELEAKRVQIAIECYEIATSYLKTCTGQAVADAIKERFRLEI